MARVCRPWLSCAITFVVVASMSSLVSPALAWCNEEITMSKFAGVAGSSGNAGTGSDMDKDTTKLNTPKGITYHPTWGIVVASSGVDRIYSIDLSTGLMSWRVGGGDGTSTGSGTSSRFRDLRQMSYNQPREAVYAADWNTHRIREVDVTGTTWSTSHKWGSGSTGGNNGIYTSAKFHTPSGIAVDPTTGDMYEGDGHGKNVRKLAFTDGQTSTIAGQYGSSAWTEGVSGVSVCKFTQYIAIRSDYAYVLINDQGALRHTRLSDTYTFDVTCMTTGDVDGTLAAAQCAVGSSPIPHRTDTSVVYFYDQAAALFKKVTSTYVYTVAGDGDSTSYNLLLGTNGGASIGKTVDYTYVNSTLYMSSTSNHIIGTVDFTTVDPFAGHTFTTAEYVGLAMTSGTCTLGTGADESTPICGPTALHVGAHGTHVAAADATGHVVYRSGPLTYLAGSAAGTGSADGASATFTTIAGIAVSSDGASVYIVDSSRHTLRTINGGTTTTTAGTDGTASAANGVGGSALFHTPSGIALSSDDVTAYVSEDFGSIVRTVALSSATVGLLAGTSWNGADTSHQGDVNGPVSTAKFNGLGCIAIDGANSWLFVGDKDNFKLRRVIAYSGTATDYACSGTSGTADGTAQAATCGAITSVAVDTASAAVFFAHGLYLRRANTGAVVTIFTPTSGYYEGPVPQFASIDGLSASGNKLYVADGGNNLVRVVTWLTSTATPSALPKDVHYSVREGRVEHWVGSTTSGNVDAVGTAAILDEPRGCVVDGNGTVYFADVNNHRLRKVYGDGTVEHFAGSTTAVAGHTDGAGATAAFDTPAPMLLSLDGLHIYISDLDRNCIRRVYIEHADVSTWAGTCSTTGSFAEGTAGAIGFEEPRQMAIDPDTGDIYVTDRENSRIRMITSAVVSSTVLGDGTVAYLEGTGSGAHLNKPAALVFQTDIRQLIWSDAEASATRMRYAPISTFSSALLAGDGTEAVVDGTGAAAQFDKVTSMVLHPNNRDIWIVENRHHLRRVNYDTKQVWTVVGTGTAGWTSNADPLQAQVQYVFGVCRSHSEFLLVTGDHAISKVYFETGTASPSKTPTPALDKYRPSLREGRVEHLVGGTTSGTADGASPTGRLDQPRACVVDGNGTVYVTEQDSNRVREFIGDTALAHFAGSTAQASGTTSGSGDAARFNQPHGLVLLPSGVDIVVVDRANDCLRNLYTPTATVSDYFGQCGTSGYAEGVGTAAKLSDAVYVALDAHEGTLLLPDRYNEYMRKIDIATVSSSKFLGTGSNTYLEGTGTAAELAQPFGVAYRAVGSREVVWMDSSSGNCRLRKAGTTSAVTAFVAGDGTDTMLAGGGASARIKCQAALVVHPKSSDVYILASWSWVFRLNLETAQLWAAVGTGTDGWTDNDDPLQALVKVVTGVCFNADATKMYVVGTHAISKVYFETHTVTPSLTVPPVSHRYSLREGRMEHWLGGGAETTIEGSGTSALLDTPFACTFDSNNSMYFAEPLTQRIRVVRAESATTEFWVGSTTSESGSVNGFGTAALLTTPRSLVPFNGGLEFYVAGSENCIRKIYVPTAEVTTFAGTCGTDSYAEGVGTAALFSSIRRLASDEASDQFYVCDFGNSRIRKIPADGVTSTAVFLGDGTSAYLEGTGTGARVADPSALAVRSGAGGDVVWSDTLTSNYRIRRATAAGVTSFVAGSGANGWQDGTGAAATLGFISSMVIHPNGVDVYLAEGYDQARRLNLLTAQVWRAVGTGIAGWVSSGVAKNGQVSAVRGFCFHPDLSVVYVLGDHAISKVYFETATQSASSTAELPVAVDATRREGRVDLLVGSTTQGTADGAGTAAELYWPRGCVINSNGTVYFSEGGSDRLRELRGEAAAYHWVGPTDLSTGTATGNASTARFNEPSGMLLLPSGVDIIVVDRHNNCLRNVYTPAGDVTDYLGLCGTSGYVDGSGTTARLSQPRQIAFNPHTETLILADTNNDRLRTIPLSTGSVSVFIGTGADAYLEGTGTAAQLAAPSGIAFSVASRVVVWSDANTAECRLRTVDAGTATTAFLAGDGTDAATDGTGSGAQIKSHAVLVAHFDGHDVYLFESLHFVRRASLDSGMVWRVIGDGTSGWTSNADPQQAHVTTVLGGCLDTTSSKLFVLGSHAISRMRFETRTVSVTASLPAVPHTRYAVREGRVERWLGGQTSGNVDGVGTDASFYIPKQCAVDGNGTVFIADQYNHRVRIVRPEFPTTEPLAGALDGTNDFADGTGDAARFNAPEGLVLFPSGAELLVTDVTNDCIRKIYIPTAEVTTFAGLCATGGYGEAVGTAARFDGPVGIALSPASQTEFFVTDRQNHRIRTLPVDPTLSTALFVGGGTEGNVDGTGGGVQVAAPTAIIARVDGGILWADASSSVTSYRIRRATAAAVTSFVAGSGALGDTDGTGASAVLGEVVMMVAHPNGDDVYLMEKLYVLRRLNLLTAQVWTVAGTGSGGWIDNDDPLSAHVHYLNSGCMMGTSTLLLVGRDAVAKLSFITATASISPAPTPTFSFSTTQSTSSTRSESRSPSVSVTTTRSLSSSHSVPPTPTVSLSLTLSKSGVTQSSSPSASQSGSRSAGTSSASSTLTASSSVSRSSSVTTSLSVPPTPTETGSGSATVSATVTPAPTPTVSFTASLPPTPSQSLSVHGLVPDDFRFALVNTTEWAYSGARRLHVFASSRTSRYPVRIVATHSSNGSDCDSWWLERQQTRFVVRVDIAASGFSETWVCATGFPCTQHVPLLTAGTFVVNATLTFALGEQLTRSMLVTVEPGTPTHVAFEARPTVVVAGTPFAVRLRAEDASNNTLLGADVLQGYAVTLTLTSTDTAAFASLSATGEFRQGGARFDGLVMTTDDEDVRATTVVPAHLAATTTSGLRTITTRLVTMYACPADSSYVSPRLLNMSRPTPTSTVVTFAAPARGVELYDATAAAPTCQMLPFALAGTYARIDPCFATCTFASLPEADAAVPTVTVNVTWSTDRDASTSYGPLAIVRGPLTLRVTPDAPLGAVDVPASEHSRVRVGCVSVALVDAVGTVLPGVFHHSLYVNGAAQRRRQYAESAMETWRLCNVSAAVPAAALLSRTSYDQAFTFRLLANGTGADLTRPAAYNSTLHVRVYVGSSLCHTPSLFNETVEGCLRSPPGLDTRFANCTTEAAGASFAASLVDAPSEVAFAAMAESELCAGPVSNSSRRSHIHEVRTTTNGTTLTTTHARWLHTGVRGVAAHGCGVPTEVASRTSAAFQGSYGSPSLPRRAAVALFEDGKYAESGLFATIEAAPVTLDETPAALYVTGCYDAYPSTGECDQSGNATITIVGRNFDRIDAPISVTLVPQGGASAWPDNTTCATVHSHAATAVVVSGCAGFGVNATVTIVGVNASSGANQTYPLGEAARVSFAVKGEAACGRNPDTGELCSGRGTCSGDQGACTCDSSAARGYHEGAACESCQSWYANSTDCATRCPGTSVPCSGNGVCSEGACFCFDGFAGTSCGIECAGGATSPCNRHGACNRTDGTCACDSNATHGYFTGAACSACVSGWSGSTCLLACPLNPTDGLTVCSARGACADGACTCDEGYCGTACETAGESCFTCASGYWGTGCANECNGGAANPCGGLGSCSGGTNGDGSCACDSGRAGNECQLICAGGVASPCSGHGTCAAADGSCTCDPGYAGADCGVACPATSSGGVCDGRGTCDAGASGTGLCACDLGYSGTDCTSTCPGGVSAPCNWKGVCNANVTCTCAASNATGYWGGADCGECAAGWAGSECKQQCVFADGVQCGGNGVCNSATIECECYADSVDGFWTGAACDACVGGYFGANCTTQCPGFGCGVCSGHGNCSDGRVGAGTCSCIGTEADGFWGGTDCGDCADSYFGPSCTLRCPLNRSTCGGNGACDQGLEGSGACICAAGFSHDADGECTLCTSGFFGNACARCGIHPNATDLTANATDATAFNYSASCSGRGTCADGIGGNGSCACDVGYAGDYCTLSCPVADGATCGLGGACTVDGCVCAGTYTLASDGTCSACQAGWFGGDCSGECPDCGATGQCRDGVSGDGACECVDGYWGDACTDECPGGASDPCSGHGTCDKASGECACQADDAAGHFAGIACAACAAAWESPNCTVACPTFGQQVCNGRGTCWNGTCTGCAPLPSDTASVYCGEQCHQSGIVCLTFATECPPGFWGFGCFGVCPGADPTTGNNSCADHGTCNTDSGACICDSGFAGFDCSSSCPVVRRGNHDYICAGHGTCANSTCTCTHGYWGASCSSECRGGASNPCNGVGLCHGVTGECRCEPGMAGANCDIECEGGRDNACSGRGTCEQDDGSCTCRSSAGAGFFDGDACERCAAGYGVGTCQERCVHGASRATGYDCLCEPGYGGPTCDVECPTLDGTDGVCSGHGVCSDGHAGDATCTCTGGFFSADCSRYCTVDRCRDDDGLAHPQCNAATGQCECEDTPTARWAGAKCDECQAGYWGGSCNLLCPCNDHGDCDQTTGECYCYSDDVSGYWAGQSCGECRSGYIGRNCRGKNIEFSANADMTVTASVETVGRGDDAAPLTFVDEAARVAYAGSGSPLIVVDRSTTPFRVSATLTLPGGEAVAAAVVAATAAPVATAGTQTAPESAATAATGTLSVTMLNPATLELTTVSFPRGPNITDADVTVLSAAASSTSRRQRALLQASTNATTDNSTAAPAATNTTAAAAAAAAVDVAAVARHAELGGAIAAVLRASPPRLRVAIGDWVDDDAGGLAGQFSAIRTVAPWTGGFVVAGTQQADTTQWLVAVVTVTAASADDSTPPAASAAALMNASSHSVAPCDAEATGPCAAALRCIESRLTPTSVGFTCAFRGGSDSVIAARLDATLASANAVIVPSTATSAPRTAPASELVALSGTVVNVTAMALDGTADLVMLALHSDVSASLLFKVREGDMVVSGQLTFQQVGLEYERVVAVALREAEREALVTVRRGQYSTEVLSVNVFGVLSITPAILDARGGAAVTVAGEGFNAFDAVECVFGTRRVNATFLNLSAAVCTAPPTTTTGGSCDALNFNVRVGARQTATTNVPFQRPAQAALDGALVQARYPFAPAGYATTVSVRGVGFVASPWGVCRVRQGSASAASAQLLSVARFVNTTAVECVVPANFAATLPPAFVEYSHDGQLFGAVATPFTVVGEAQGIAIRTPAPHTTFRAADSARMPTTVVDVVDRNQNSLYHLDPLSRPLTLRLLRGDTASPFAWTNSTAATRTIADGTATLVDLFVVRPTAGALTLEASVRVGAVLWTASVSVTVLVGVPTRVALASGNASAAWYIGTTESVALAPDPTVVVTDAAGNHATDTSEIPAVIVLDTVTYDIDSVTGEGTERTVSLQATAEEGRYMFRDVKLQSIYGRLGGLRFTAASRPDVQQLDVERIPLQRCADSEYGKTSTALCLPCPAFGVCDGTTSVSVQDGFWRGSGDTTTFYECSPPYAADSCGRSGRCDEGYEGPRCSVCEAGYGKTGLACSECWPAYANYILLALVVAVLLGAVFFLVNNSINAGAAAATGKPADIIAVIIKMLLNHFQVCATTGLSNSLMPPALEDFFRGQQSASSMSPNLSFVTCTVTPTYYDQFQLMAASPLLVLPIVVAQLAFVVVVVRAASKAKDTLRTSTEIAQSGVDRNRRSLMDERDTQYDSYDAFASLMKSSIFLPPHSRHETAVTSARTVREAAANIEVPTAPRLWLQRSAVSVLVVLFFLYPTILEVSGNMLLCESIEYGGSRGTESVLFVDRGINCGTGEYSGYRSAALVQLVVYGAGLPVVAVLLVKLVSVCVMGGDFARTKMLFYFMTGGYREALWFWESVILLRKAAVVMIAFAIDDTTLRIYAGMWAMGVFVVLNAVLQPFENAVLLRLETLSLITITASLNLSLLFPYVPEASSPGGFYTVLSLIFVVNGGMLAVFLVELVRAVRDKLKGLVEADRFKYAFLRGLIEEPVEVVMARTDKLETAFEAERVAYRAANPRFVLVEDAVVDARQRFPENVSILLAVRKLDDFVRCGAFRMQSYGSSALDTMEFFRLEADVMGAILDAEQQLNRDAELLEIDLACEQLMFESRDTGSKGDGNWFVPDEGAAEDMARTVASQGPGHQRFHMSMDVPDSQSGRQQQQRGTADAVPKSKK